MSELKIEYLNVLENVNLFTERDEKNERLVKIVGEIQQKYEDGIYLTPFEKKLLGFYEKEWDHKTFVNLCLREVHNKRIHDWSKDYYYTYVLAGKFEFLLEDEGFSENYLEEVNRHYYLEAHHVQHQQTGGVIRMLDVQEMAIDQLCRSCEKNKGKIDSERNSVFRPIFAGDEREALINAFDKYMNKYESMVKKIYRNFIKE